MTTSYHHAYHDIETAIDDFATAVRRAENLLHTGKMGEFTNSLELVSRTRKRLNALIVTALAQQKAMSR